MLAAPCRAEAEVAFPVDIEERIELATRVMEAGDLPRAERLLAELAQVAPHHRQVRFLRAHLAIRQGDPERAIDLLRGLLSENPSLIRVRLDLARTLYETGNYEAAIHHFDLALGADLPPAVRANVRAYLDLLRHAHTYLSVNAFLAHDSNANQGPNAATIYLFGLPFELTPESRPKSATGLVVQANGRVALGPGRRSYLLANIEEREYDDASIDYSFVQAGAGHSVPLGNWRLGAEGGYYDSRFQHRPLSGGPWVRAYGSVKVGPKLLVSPSLQRRRNRYQAYPWLSGTQDFAALDASFAFAPRLSLAAGLTLTRNSTADPLYSYRGEELRIGGVAEFPFGFIVEATAGRANSVYDAEDVFFGARRRDRQDRVELNITQRAWRLWRFAPKLVTARVRNQSNVALYDWDRDIVGLGVTTRF